jgi:hypothetical protein
VQTVRNLGVFQPNISVVTPDSVQTIPEVPRKQMRFSAIELEPSTLCIGFESADDERLDVLPVDRIGNKQVGVLSNTDQDKAPSIRSVLSRARARHLHLHPRPRSVAGQDVA